MPAKVTARGGGGASTFHRVVGLDKHVRAACTLAHSFSLPLVIPVEFPPEPRVTLTFVIGPFSLGRGPVLTAFCFFFLRAFVVLWLVVLLRLIMYGLIIGTPAGLQDPDGTRRSTCRRRTQASPPPRTYPGSSLVACRLADFRRGSVLFYPRRRY